MLRYFYFLFFLLLVSFSFAQHAVSGFRSKISGEDINYFSPFRDFANEALLTRCNGVSAIEWEASKMPSQNNTAVYQFLIGFSNGTSGADRLFDVYLNDSLLFTFKTEKNWMERQTLQLACNFSPQAHYNFTLLEKDINKDIFGYLTIELPEKLRDKQRFKIVGRDAQSRDWLMVFKFRPQTKINAQASALVLRAEQKRPINVQCLIESGVDSILFSSAFIVHRTRLQPGYHYLTLPAYPSAFVGADTLRFRAFSGGQLLVDSLLFLELKPIQELTFQLIHHSHNDIGYSHLQTEVAKIQTENIRAALRWIASGAVGPYKPVWHIESLWAVENFLHEASAAEEAAFVASVKAGQLVLSANYANCLTGLMRPAEFNWLTEYAQQLENKYGIQISNAMVTDIPGQTYAAFEAYTRQGIPYLSLGPNYVQHLPDHGDRVGGVINETGDKPFYWYAKADSSQKLLVWTAGKGYSYFHNIAPSQQFFEWEKRLSNYTQELNAYPFAIVQLRYTKNADNGPVDTTLCQLVSDWNQKYSSPQLRIANLDTLFSEFAQRYEAQIPLRTGEISPYWEDGTYSTAAEEIQMRLLVKEVIDFEEKLNTDQKQQHQAELREIHRNLILFHEHTWGAWCSISAPDVFFTTEQWRIKKAFLDSAQAQYFLLEQRYHKPLKCNKLIPGNFKINWDQTNSGIRSLQYKNQELLRQDTPGLGACVYSLGIAPQVNEHLLNSDNDPKMGLQSIAHPNVNIKLQYLSTADPNLFHLKFTIDKKAIREKEALHICLPFDLNNPTLSYGEQTLLTYSEDQLPGSNKEFICVPDHFILEDAKWRITVYTPDCNLLELGAPIDETQITGAKVWKRTNQAISPLYIYVFNNYWHTNYKADQEGVFEVSVKIRVEKK